MSWLRAEGSAGARGHGAGKNPMSPNGPGMRGCQRSRCALSWVAFRNITIAAALLQSLFGGTGCTWTEQEYGRPRFSADGRWIAYAVGDTGMKGIPGSYLETWNWQKFCVGWCDPAIASQRWVIPIDVGGPAGPWRADYVIDPKFSPDGRFLAIVTRFNGVLVVELDTGRHWRATPPGEEITSSSWCGERELGYMVHTNSRGEDRAISDRALWRVPVDNPEGRRRIFQEANVPSTLRLRWALWSPDGSGVLCLSQDDEPTDGNDRPFRVGEVLLVSPGDQRVRDLTREFQASFDGCQYGLPASWVKWSTDGRYLLIALYACLVRLDPWQVVRLEGTGLRQGTPFRVVTSHIGTLPVPERLWSLDEDTRLVMIDYAGQPVARWARRLPKNYDLTFSPDGRFVVIRDTWNGNRLDIRPLDWTPLN